MYTYKHYRVTINKGLPCAQLPCIQLCSPLVLTATGVPQNMKLDIIGIVLLIGGMAAMHAMATPTDLDEYLRQLSEVAAKEGDDYEIEKEEQARVAQDDGDGDGEENELASSMQEDDDDKAEAEFFRKIFRGVKRLFGRGKGVMRGANRMMGRYGMNPYGRGNPMGQYGGGSNYGGGYGGGYRPRPRGRRQYKKCGPGARGRRCRHRNKGRRG